MPERPRVVSVPRFRLRHRPRVCRAGQQLKNLEARTEIVMRKTFAVALSIITLIGWSSNALADGGIPVVTHVVTRPGQLPLASLSTENRGPVIARADADDAG